MFVGILLPDLARDFRVLQVQKKTFYLAIPFYFNENTKRARLAAHEIGP